MGNLHNVITCMAVCPRECEKVIIVTVVIRKDGRVEGEDSWQEEVNQQRKPQILRQMK